MALSHAMNAADRAMELLASHGVVEPPVHIEDLVHAEGIEVTRAAAKGTEAAFVYRHDGRRVIGLNPRIGITRESFALAHSLGHMLLHDGALIVDHVVRAREQLDVPTLATRAQEIEASQFAAEVLMPTEMILDEAAELADPTISRGDFLVAMRTRFRVSQESMSARLIALGVLSG